MGRSEHDRVTVARLCGTATRHTHDQTEPGSAVAELVAIATEGGRVRVDLLEAAAGSLLGGWEHSGVNYWSGRDAALLLVRAGASWDRVKELAAVTRTSLANSTRSGIGNPRSA